MRIVQSTEIYYSRDYYKISRCPLSLVSISITKLIYTHIIAFNGTAVGANNKSTMHSA